MRFQGQVSRDARGIEEEGKKRFYYFNFCNLPAQNKYVFRVQFQDKRSESFEATKENLPKAQKKPKANKEPKVTGKKQSNASVSRESPDETNVEV